MTRYRRGKRTGILMKKVRRVRPGFRESKRDTLRRPSGIFLLRTVRLARESWQRLKVLAAMWDCTMYEALDRLVAAEWPRYLAQMREEK